MHKFKQCSTLSPGLMLMGAGFQTAKPRSNLKCNNENKIVSGTKRLIEVNLKKKVQCNLDKLAVKYGRS